MSESEAAHEPETSPAEIRGTGSLNGLLRLRRQLARIQSEAHLLSADAQGAFREIVQTLRDTLALDAIGQELPKGTQAENGSDLKRLHVLWSGGVAEVALPLLSGLAGTKGWPRLTLATDLKSAWGQVGRKKPDLWVVTLGSQDELRSLQTRMAEFDSPPLVVVLSSAFGSGDIGPLRNGGLEYVSERELTADKFRELATRALVRRRFIEDLSEAQKRVEELVHRDALTGLHNRRYFESRLSIEFARAARFGEALTLVLFDVDHFKEVNDTHGHLAGDQVLVQTGQLLQGAVRSIDLVARVGGEEFALLLPNTGALGAPGLVQRIIDRVRQHPFGEDTSPIRVTLSAGIAACPHQNCAREQALYERADQALYLAKRRGRDRLEVYEPAPG